MFAFQDGKQFPDVYTFGEVYTNKLGEWKSKVAKAQYNEMIAKKTAYVEALASQYPKGTPVEDYPFLRRHVVIMDTLGEAQLNAQEAARLATDHRVDQLEADRNSMWLLLQWVAAQMPGISIPSDLGSVYAKEDH
ncbi:hypothetical protein L3X38_043555 [Prunus dulcis]|uniref:Uncharacterized protein n=1 Tax=Prunus dulcis TaxID=3755 RepID=A0AAD4YML1_PRUDU|nr:hypothetical protein L3X38_043555 [Prunus dulcis]